VSIQRLIGRLIGIRDRSARSAVRFPVFDITGWQERQRSENQIVWTSNEGDSLLVTITALDRFRPLSDEKWWRNHCRPIAEGKGGGIVSGDSFEQEPAPMFQFIYKREDGWVACSRDAVHTAPGDNMCDFVELQRTRVTGTREALVTVQLAEEAGWRLNDSQNPM